MSNTCLHSRTRCRHLRGRPAVAVAHTPGRLLAAGVAAVVLVGVALDSVPQGAPGHQLWTSVASAAPVPSPSVTAAQPQVDPQLTAIQQVIQRANDEKARGVTNIRLTNLSWGPITINGPTATATTYETWITTFSDGTTVQSTDINVYTLMQQAGGWIIQDNQQPSPPQPAATSSFDVARTAI